MSSPLLGRTWKRKIPPGDPLWGQTTCLWEGHQPEPDCHCVVHPKPRGEKLTALLGARLEQQVRMTMADAVLVHRLHDALGATSGRAAAEAIVESMIAERCVDIAQHSATHPFVTERLKDRLLYGTVRRLSEYFRRKV